MEEKRQYRPYPLILKDILSVNETLSIPATFEILLDIRELLLEQRITAEKLMNPPTTI